MNRDDFINAYKKAKEERDRELYKELLTNGVLGNGIIFLNPKHKGIIEKVLYDAGIKRNLIVYSSAVEEDQLVFTTNKEMVENAKRILFFGEEAE